MPATDTEPYSIPKLIAQTLGIDQTIPLSDWPIYTVPTPFPELAHGRRRGAAPGRPDFPAKGKRVI